MIKVGIIGATGYAGSELVRLITQHPKAELVTMTSQSYAGQEYKEVYSNYSHLDYVCEEEHIEEMAEKCVYGRNGHVGFFQKLEKEDIASILHAAI